MNSRENFPVRITGILFLFLLGIHPVMQSKPKNQDELKTHSNLNVSPLVFSDRTKSNEGLHQVQCSSLRQDYWNSLILEPTQYISVRI